MKLLQLIGLFFLILLLSNCSYSKENNNEKLISRENVSICKFENENIDFCSIDKILLYNRHLKDFANFSNDKIFLSLNHRRNIGRGEEKIVKIMVILDPSKKIVTPVPQIVGNFVDSKLREISDEPAKIEFRKNNNKFCLSGTTYSLKDNNINVENECYKFENSKIFKIKDKNIKIENIDKFSNLPYYSDIHINCINNSNKLECKNLKLFTSNEIIKDYNFINSQDGGSVFLRANKKYFLIVSPFFDEEGRFLRIMQVENERLISEKYFYIDRNLEIDNDLKIRYFEGDSRKEFIFK